jgi:hypothetical protein
MYDNLPLHPSLRHPLTGEPLRAVYVDKHGRPRYSIMGGAPDDPPDAAAKAAADAAAATAAAEAKAAADAAAAKAAEDAKKGDEGKDLGFPKDTPVAEMNTAQQAAYHRHQSQKHESRNRELLKITGGKHGDDLRKEFEELEKLRKSQMSDGEKAVAEAKVEGRREASLALVPQMFDVALSHVDEDRRKVLMANIDPTRVLNSDGTIDTDKVSTIAAALAPADKGTGSDRDYGQGRRTSGGSRPGSVESVMAARREAREAKAGKQ